MRRELKEYDCENSHKNGTCKAFFIAGIVGDFFFSQAHTNSMLFDRIAYSFDLATLVSRQMLNTESFQNRNSA